MSKVLLAGESWVSAVVDHKGFDPFPHTQVEIGCADFVKALTAGGHEVTHMRSHDVAADFPRTLDELAAHDVVILSDIGSNSLLLPPEVFARGERVPNRLRLLCEWVEAGGGLMMAGGYLSFQGIQAKANYHGTPLEDVLPVDILPYDDRVETPEGIEPELTDVAHEVTKGLERTWPYLLGYQRLAAKPDAKVLARVGDDPLLLLREVGRGRTAAYASDISPHWAPPPFVEWAGYGRLFCQLVGWLGGA